MKKQRDRVFGHEIAGAMTAVDVRPQVAEDIRSRIHADLRCAQVAEVMDMYDLASYLKVEVEDVETMLDQLPHFEFAGKIRFRKIRIEEWLAEREGIARQGEAMSDLHSWKRFSAGPVRLEVIA